MTVEDIAHVVRQFEEGRAIWAYGSETERMNPIRDLNVIDATAFAMTQSEHLVNGMTKDQIELPLSDFEDCRPPFDDVMIAYSYEPVVKLHAVKPAWRQQVFFCSVERIKDEPDRLNDIANSQWDLRIMTGEGKFIEDIGQFAVVMPRTIWGIKLDENGKVTRTHREVNPGVDGEISSGDSSIENFHVYIALAVFNMANCANVQLVEPKRQRAERRRLDRVTKTAITNLMIEGTRARSHSHGGSGDSLGLIPAHTVRGHVAHYGACCPWHEPRGLLFGRLTKKVWVPSHARGNAEAGERKHSYTVRPDQEI